jgi:hypothetical protein
MSPPDPSRLARLAAFFALPGLGLMTWSVLSPRPVPVVLAMTLGQVIGTASLALYVLAILVDLRRAHIFGKSTREGSPSP